MILEKLPGAAALADLTTYGGATGLAGLDLARERFGSQFLKDLVNVAAGNSTSLLAGIGQKTLSLAAIDFALDLGIHGAQEMGKQQLEDRIASALKTMTLKTQAQALIKASKSSQQRDDALYGALIAAPPRLSSAQTTAVIADLTARDQAAGWTVLRVAQGEDAALHMAYDQKFGVDVLGEFLSALVLNGAPLVAGALLGPEAVPAAAGLAGLWQVQAAAHQLNADAQVASLYQVALIEQEAYPTMLLLETLTTLDEVQHGRVQLQPSAAMVDVHMLRIQTQATRTNRLPEPRDVLRFTVRNESNVTTSYQVIASYLAAFQIAGVHGTAGVVTALTGMRINGQGPVLTAITVPAGGEINVEMELRDTSLHTWLEPATGDLISLGLVASLPAGGDLLVQMRQLRWTGPEHQVMLPPARFQDTGASYRSSHYRPLPCIPMGSRIALLSELTGICGLPNGPATRSGV